MSENGSDRTNTGRIIEIKGVVIDAVFPDRLPEIYTALEIESPEGDDEPHARGGGAAASRRRPRPCRRDGLDRRPRRAASTCVDTGGPITVPVGEATLGRLWNVIGEPIDEQADARGDIERWSIHRDPPAFRDLSPKIEIFETGLKVIDLIAPYINGGKVGLFGGAGVGKTVLIQELIHNVAHAARRRLGLRGRRRAHARGQRPSARDDGVGRARQGRARLRADERAAGRAPSRRPLRADDGGVLPRRRQGRPPLHRQHLPLHRRRAPRCRRCSAACRARSATSRRSRPRWASCRSGSPRRRRARSPRCRRSTSRRTTSPTRRRRTRSRTSTRPPCSTRAIVEKGIYPAVDPLDSSSRALQPGIVSDEHYEVATRVQEILQRYKDLQDIIAILGMDELTDEHKLAVARARRSSASSRSRTSSPSSSPGTPGKYVKLEDTIRGLPGDHRRASTTSCPSRRSTWSATIEEAVEKARQLPRPPPRRASMADAHPKFDVALVTPDGAGVRGRGRDAHRPRRGRRDRRPRAARPACGDAQGGLDAHPCQPRTRYSSSPPGPASSRSSPTARSRSSTTPSSVEGDRRRPRARAARGRAGGAREGRGGRVDRRPLAARAAHQARREPALRLRAHDRLSARSESARPDPDRARIPEGFASARSATTQPTA